MAVPMATAMAETAEAAPSTLTASVAAMLASTWVIRAMASSRVSGATATTFSAVATAGDYNMGKGSSVLRAGCCVPRVGTGDDGGGLPAENNPDALAGAYLANAGGHNDFSSGVHVGASLGIRGDVLDISIPGMTTIGDDSSLPADSGIHTGQGWRRR
jgi:hypothetical protein